ncbi:hypothetical protein GCM10023322_51450 [Rugosimonospora acidiphila]|uniref:DUF4265 domain-containing protein n=1 Tax=Rugosimonospora acidiphila TaxID=556531 RepID=A0ABP9S8M7_9ACTN
MTVAGQDPSHVRLLAGNASSGRPVYEAVPALPVEPGVYDVLGTPGLAAGCAAGDRIRVGDDGKFEVLRRGGNLCLLLYPSPPPADDEVAVLVAAFQRLDGLVELPPHRRFVVITVPVTAGFEAVEDAVNGWTAARGCPWEYGNVYDDDGEALGWWRTG